MIAIKNLNGQSLILTVKLEIPKPDRPNSTPTKGLRYHVSCVTKHVIKNGKLIKLDCAESFFTTNQKNSKITISSLVRP